jgi:hypothetical protein
MSGRQALPNRVTSEWPVHPSTETQAARTAELSDTRLWGTKMRSDEERLQRNHHAIPDVFI